MRRKNILSEELKDGDLTLIFQYLFKRSLKPSSFKEIAQISELLEYVSRLNMYKIEYSKERTKESHKGYG